MDDKFYARITFINSRPELWTKEDKLFEEMVKANLYSRGTNRFDAAFTISRMVGLIKLLAAERSKDSVGK